MRPRSEPGSPSGWIGGPRAVLAALRTGRPPVLRLLVAEGKRDRRAGEVIDLARRQGVPWSRGPRAALDRLSGGVAHQGVVAEVGQVGYTDRVELLAGAPRPELLVILDGIQDAGNLGAILRTAAATGVGGVFIPRHRAAGLTEGAARAAAGTMGLVPVARERNIADLVADLQEGGIACWALDAGGESPWDRPDLSGRVALVAGSEEKGVRRLVRERCQGSLRLPLARGVGSLNVGVALGAVLFEAVRQRGGADRRKPDMAG